jgi:hypothetical protein
MLRIGLDGGGETKQLRLVRTRDPHERRLTLRERPRLVEDDHLELAGSFERNAVLHEKAVASPKRANSVRALLGMA